MKLVVILHIILYYIAKGILCKGGIIMWRKVLIILSLVLLLGVCVATESSNTLIAEEDDYIEWNTHGEKDIFVNI